MSLQSLLSIARSAMLTHQRNMAVTGHNVANASTPGYSRQRLSLSAESPLLSPLGAIGRGVTADGIVRVRDQFFDASFRRESGNLGRAGTMADLLGQVEAAFDEPNGSGVSAALDGMFQAFADLANDPSSAPNRDLARRAAQRFAHQLQSLDRHVASATSDATARLVDQVGQVNRLAQEIAELNAGILAAGGNAPDLMDQRDRLVDQLSSLMDVRVQPRADGSYAILAGDVALVDGGLAQKLEVRTGIGTVAIGVVGSAGVVDPRSGSLDALLELAGVSLPALRSRLDEFARAVAVEINAIHRTGTTPGGATGTDFFDPAYLTAGSLRLTAAIEASANAIATGATSAPGDGSVALAIAGLATRGVGSLGGITMREYYVGIAAGVGIEVRNAAQDTATHQSLVDHAETQRQSISGVSIDEEMVNLIAQQQAYQAAARLVSVADEMMQDMLRML